MLILNRACGVIKTAVRLFAVGVFLSGAGVMYAQQAPAVNGGQTARVKELYKKRAMQLSKSDLNGVGQINSDIYAGLLKLQANYLPLTDRLYKGISLQSSVINGQRLSVVPVSLQNAVSHIISHSMNELRMPATEQKYDLQVIRSAYEDLAKAEIASLRAEKMSPDAATGSQYMRSMEDALFYMEQALSKLNRKSPDQQNQSGGTPQDNKQADAGNNNPSAQNNAGAQQNQDKSDAGKNEDNAVQDNAQQQTASGNSKDEKQTEQNSTKSGYNGIDSGTSEQIKKYEEYKKQAISAQMKHLGLNEAEAKRLQNPRLKVEKDW